MACSTVNVSLTLELIEEEKRGHGVKWNTVVIKQGHHARLAMVRRVHFQEQENCKHLCLAQHVSHMREQNCLCSMNLSHYLKVMSTLHNGSPASSGGHSIRLHIPYPCCSGVGVCGLSKGTELVEQECPQIPPTQNVREFSISCGPLGSCNKIPDLD